ncbi:MAG: ATP-binding cassette domain-containing protein [Haloferacaceae archaeon]
MPPDAPKLRAERLSFSVEGETVLHGVDLSIETGETVAVIGPSGAGKSTFLRLLDRLDEPTDGTVYLDGTDYRTIPPTELRARVGMVPQSPALRDGTVRENVAVGRRLRGEPVDPGRVEGLLEAIDLAGYADRSTADLSGGEAQRVAIARALLVEPEVLLLDEPTASLDSDAQREVERLLADLLADTDLTVVTVTHDETQATRIADRVVRLVEGRVTQVGRPGEVMA